jgi:hypothetical protein
MKEQLKQSKLSRLQKYFSGMFNSDSKQEAIEENIRARIKWVFDYLRNMMIVGVILFLGKTSHNSILTNLGLVGCGILWAYLMTYWELLSVRPFHPLKNKQLSNKLDLAFFFLVIAPLGVALQYALITVVVQVADAYASV